MDSLLTFPKMGADALLVVLFRLNSLKQAMHPGGAVHVHLSPDPAGQLQGTLCPVQPVDG
jgi:hypothetical protein